MKLSLKNKGPLLHGVVQQYAGLQESALQPQELVQRNDFHLGAVDSFHVEHQGH